MTASQLLEKLQALAASGGELPVFVAMGKSEYALSDARHEVQGALPELVGVESASPPKRIVLEVDPGAEIPVPLPV